MRISRSILPLLLGTSLALTLSACESSGGGRVASVGGQSSGQSSDDGSGSDGSGTSSTSGTLSSAGLDQVPVDDAGGTGGLVGSGGVAGTGVASNTGNPRQRSAASPILVTAGNAMLDTAGRGDTARAPVNQAAPNSAPFTGTVTQVIASTGQALVRTGDGSSYLVDDLAAAPGSAVTVGAGQGRLVGGPGSNPLIGVSVVSPTQNAGRVATLGADSNGNTLTANGPNDTALIGTGATGNTLVNADANGSQVLGNGQSSPIGVSVLSPGQASGSTLTAGVGSNGSAATVNGTSIASPTTGGNLVSGVGTGGLGGTLSCLTGR